MIAKISKISKEKFIINFLFSALFFSYIAGNLILNINIVLILILGFSIYKIDIFKIKLNLLDKLITLFFLYIILNGIINNFYYKANAISDDYTILLKSFLFLRFLLLYFLINFLIKKDILNLKIFFISASISVIFVCLDIFYQFYSGYDIFGYKGVERRLSGPFGDEWVAGSFIFRFGVISFFLYPVFFKIKNQKLLYFCLFSLFILMFLSLILSGNRTPLFLFLISLSCIIFFEKKLRRFFLAFVAVVLLLITLVYNFHQSSKDHLTSYRDKVKSFFLVFSKDNILTEKDLETNYRYDKKNNMFYTLEYKGNFYKMNNTYTKEFKTGYMTWKVNKFFGGGIKSFIINCGRAKIPNCVNHPHNYYLEILSELGIVGFILISIIFLIIAFKTFIKKYFTLSKLNENYVITPFIFLFLMEIFPIRNTGSFFSTVNATYLFLIMSILVGLLKKHNLIEKKT